MSVKVMSLVWDNFRRGGSEKLVMLAMADWCNDKGLSLHPSHDAIAEKCCISRSQAVRVVRGLVDDGFLEVIGNHFGGAPGTTKQYRLAIERLTDSVDATPKPTQKDSERDSTSATGSVDATGSTHAQRGVAPMRETGSTHATQTTIEPSIEPLLKTPRDKKKEMFDGVDPQIVADYKSVRKAKRAGDMTETAMSAMRKEAAIAGYTIEQALQTCCERGWVGFKAEWVSKGQQSYGNHREAAIQTAAKSIFKPQHIQHLTGAQEIEVQDATKTIAA